MKKLTAIFAIAFSFTIVTVHGQVPNPGFEILNPDSSISNWGNVYLFSFSLDTNGNAIQDSVLMDHYFYFPTADAHSGSFAMEMRNAWNFTTNTGRAGSASSDSDAVYSAWGSLELVPVINQPTDLSFYFQYFPVNGDSASGHLGVYDGNGLPIGEASIIISGTTSTYAYITTPVVYSQPGQAAFMSLNFSAFYTADPGFRQPSYGTRFLVDDVSLTNTTGINPQMGYDEIKVYPNPASTEIKITGLPDGIFEMEIMDHLGKIILKTERKQKMDISTLPVGVYFIRFIDDNHCRVKKFTKL